MKKTISFAFVLFILLSVPVSCMADNTIYIRPIGCSVTLPTDIYLFTQDTDTSDSQWDQFDFDPEQFVKYLKANSIYIDAVSSDGSYEILVIGNENASLHEIYNLNLYDEKELEEDYARNALKATEDLGITIDSHGVYNSGNLRFFTFSGVLPSTEQVIYIRSYITVVNGKSVQINFRKFTGFLRPEDERLVRSIVDSVKFDEILSKPKSSNSGNNLFSTAISKGIAGALTALIIGGPFYLIKMAKKKNNKAVDVAMGTAVTGETPSLSDAVRSDNAYDKQKTSPSPVLLNPEGQKRQVGESDKENNTQIPEVENAPRPKYCRFCGNKVVAGSKYCNECGKQL